MKIESHDKTIEKLLHGSYYRIPRFQRPYSWGEAQLEDFWDDIVIENEEDYFIGSVVVFPGSEGVLEIVDGQQRITTITIVLAALRDLFDEIGEADLASGVQGFLERRDKRNRYQFVLKTQTSYPYLQSQIQSYPAKKSRKEITPEEEALAFARSFFVARLDVIRASFLGDSAEPSDEAVADLVDRLETVRDRVLGLNVVHIEVDAEDDAYVIFETLNTRGLDLSLSDLLRNFLLRGLRSSNEDLDLARDRFNLILEEFDQSQASIDPSVFVHHYWLSRHDYVARKSVFRSIKKTVKQPHKSALLTDLEVDARIYRAIREPSSRDWKKEEAPIVQSLEALDVFNMALPLPLFLALLRSYDDKKIKLALVKRAMKSVESFHLLYTAVAGKSSSGGFTKMYALHARTVLNAVDAQEASKSISDLTDKLRNRRPSKEEFAAGFKELGYSSAFTQQKRLVQYVLGRILQISPSGIALDTTQHLTIEHLAPESGSKLSPSAIQSIGNLLLVPEQLNVRLDNKSFPKKKPLLEEAEGVWLDDVLLEAKRWSTSQIDRRASLLAALAYDNVWTV